MLDLHRDKNSYGVNRGELGRFFVTTGRIAALYGHTCSKSMDQPGKVASPARGQLNRKNEYFPVRLRA